MPNIDLNAVAVNAAGIADSFRAIQLTTADGDARLEELSHAQGGWIVIMERIADAGRFMEQYRVSYGKNASWGGGLPYIYDVWDAIAHSLWNNFDSISVEELVARAFEEARAAEAV